MFKLNPLKKELFDFASSSSSYLLLYPKRRFLLKQYLTTKYKNWVLLNDFLFKIHVRQIFSFLSSLIFQKKSILFIFEKQYIPYFQDVFFKNRSIHFISDSIQTSHSLLTNFSSTESQISAIVLLGNFTNLLIKSLFVYSKPIVFFGPMTAKKCGVDYFSFVNFESVESLVFLRSVLALLLDPQLFSSSSSLDQKTTSVNEPDEKKNIYTKKKKEV